VEAVVTIARRTTAAAGTFKRLQAYSVSSGLGGTFTVSIIREIDPDTVEVRVHYPTGDWDGYSFRTKRASLYPKGWITIEVDRASGLPWRRS
jgi:hypothetical protein